MPEKTSTAHPEAPKSAPSAPAMRAAESTDPVVHDLMAKRFTYEQHVTNVDADVAAMQEQKKAALAKIDELDDQLADLGYK